MYLKIELVIHAVAIFITVYIIEFNQPHKMRKNVYPLELASALAHQPQTCLPGTAALSFNYT